jgi:hypothetical protein
MHETTVLPSQSRTTFSLDAGIALFGSALTDAITRLSFWTGFQPGDKKAPWTSDPFQRILTPGTERNTVETVISRP